MKKIIHSLLLTAALCIQPVAMPQAQAFEVVFSSRTENHHPLIRLVGWFGELPVWKFLPQGHLYTTKDIEAIFGPTYSDYEYVYDYRCLKKVYTLPVNTTTERLSPPNLTYALDDPSNVEISNLVNADNPDWDCKLGRSQTLAGRLEALTKVVTSSTIYFYGEPAGLDIQEGTNS